MEKKFINFSDATKLLSLSRQTIYRFIVRGEIPSYKVGKRHLFDRDELIEWVKAKASKARRPKAKQPKGGEIPKKKGGRKQEGVTS